jgi:chromosome segregation ATPase
VLHGNLEKMVSAIGQERGKSFPSIGPYFIFDRRRFDVALKRTLDSLGELHSFSSNEYVKVKDVEEALSMISKIVGILDELDELEKRKKRIDSRRKALEKEIDEEQKKISSIQDQNEVSELSRVNEEIKELKKQVKHRLRHLQKPFLKFQRLIRSSKCSLPPNEANKLDEYLKSPFMAFATEEEKYPLLKRILQGMEDAINQRKLKLKSSRLRKAQEQMKNILHKDALDSLHQNCKATFLQRQQLLTSNTISTFKKESEQIRRDLKELKKRKNLVDSRWALLDAEHRKTHEKIETLKQELEKSALELTDKAIDVILE